jgi:hypothetical protein
MNGKDQQEMFSGNKPFIRKYVPPSNVTNTRNYVRLEHFGTQGEQKNSNMSELSIRRAPHNKSIFVGSSNGKISGQQHVAYLQHSNSPYDNV